MWVISGKHCLLPFWKRSLGASRNSGNCVGLHTASELAAMKMQMEYAELRTLDLTNNDLVKDHLRHLTGSPSNFQNELLCRFIFPKRLGALMKFFDTFSP